MSGRTGRTGRFMKGGTMTKRNTDKIKAGPGLSFPNPADLRGRQSVRATFRLSRRSIEALSIAAVHLGIKQKSLFDHLIEDTHTLQRIAREVKSEPMASATRVQKTFVLSRKSLMSLEQTCQVFETPRDALVEYSIQRLLPMIAKEKEKHRRRKALLGQMADYLDRGLRLLDAAEDALGQEDPLTVKLEGALAGVRGATEQTATFVGRCEVIEDF
jgi:hypothetical protein